MCHQHEEITITWLARDFELAVIIMSEHLNLNTISLNFFVYILDFALYELVLNC